jgi:hypothetical protein
MQQGYKGVVCRPYQCWHQPRMHVQKTSSCCTAANPDLVGDVYVTACGAITSTLALLLLVLMYCCCCCCCSEDYNWWWRAYFTSGSSALYLFAYSAFYFHSRLDIAKLLPKVIISYLLWLSWQRHVGIMLLTVPFTAHGCCYNAWSSSQMLPAAACIPCPHVVSLYIACLNYSVTCSGTWQVQHGDYFVSSQSVG